MNILAIVAKCSQVLQARTPAFTGDDKQQPASVLQRLKFTFNSVLDMSNATANGMQTMCRPLSGYACGCRCISLLDVWFGNADSDLKFRENCSS